MPHSVDVQIMLPGEHAESRRPHLVGYSGVEALLEAGVKFRRYNLTLPQLKMMIIDRAVVSSGSAKLNHRSLGKDGEYNVTILSRELAEMLAAHFDEDLQHARAIYPLLGAARPAALQLREKLTCLVKERLWLRGKPTPHCRPIHWRRHAPLASALANKTAASSRWSFR